MNNRRLPHVLVICNDVVGDRMAGPAIRCWEMARSLQRHFPVKLAIPNEPGPEIRTTSTVPLVTYSSENLKSLCQNHDIVVIQGWVLELHPEISSGNNVVIVDLYDPISLECLEIDKSDPVNVSVQKNIANVGVLNRQMLIGDYFICASERQRDYWMGALTSLLRVNPQTHRSERPLIDVVPFGVSETPPSETDEGIRVRLGIPEDALVLLWGGGIWNWFDPLTVIRAMHVMRNSDAQPYLVFMGTKHPNPAVPEMEMCQRAIQLSKELELYGHQVFFNTGWVPYDQRQGVLLDADAGVSSHFDSWETRLAFRTRILDYLWAGLPVLSTRGDVLSDMVVEYEAGIQLAFESVDGWCHAIEQVSDPSRRVSFSSGARALAEEMTWDKVTRPLIEFCTHAAKSEDADVDTVNHVRQTLSASEPSQAIGPFRMRFSRWIHDWIQT